MAGAREGYAFKNGPQGVGYYKDAAAAAREQPREPPPAVPAPSAAADTGSAPADDDGGDELLMQPLEGTCFAVQARAVTGGNAEASRPTTHVQLQSVSTAHAWLGDFSARQASLCMGAER